MQLASQNNKKSNITKICKNKTVIGFCRSAEQVKYTELHICVGNFSPAMGARNQVRIGLSYWPASLCSLANQFQTRFLELIPRPIAGLKFSTLYKANDSPPRTPPPALCLFLSNLSLIMYMRPLLVSPKRRHLFVTPWPARGFKQTDQIVSWSEICALLQCIPEP